MNWILIEALVQCVYMMFVYEEQRVHIQIDTTEPTGWWKTLADGLQFGPWVDATYFHWWIVVEDVVAQLFQWRLGVSGGKLSCIFNFFPHFHINLLQRWNKVLNSAVEPVKKQYGHDVLFVLPWAPPRWPCCCWACGPSTWRWGHSYHGPPGSRHVYGSWKGTNWCRGVVGMH